MEHTLVSKKTFRFEVLNAEYSPKKVLYVLHGYGQLAKFFIRKFASISTDYLIVAPEGMHRFYRNGSSGRVGASWMTKEAREIDIKDNISWLNSLDEKICNEYNIEEKSLLGFSQGGATALRWKLSTQNDFSRTIIWASDFPPDMENKLENLKKDDNNLFVVGDQDQFFNLEAQSRLTTFYKNNNFKIIHYSGGHDISPSVLKELFVQKK